MLKFRKYFLRLLYKYERQTVMADLETCCVRTAPTLPRQVIRKMDLDAYSGRLALTQTLNAGDQTLTLDYGALGLVVPPAAVRVLGVSKTEAGQDNLYASVIEGWTATEAAVELNAPCDVTGRNLQYQVIP